MGPFLLGKTQLRFLIVAIDYFTKWVEAKTVMPITKAKVISFYQTMESSLTISSFKNFAKTQESRITTFLPDTLRLTAKQK